MTIFITYYNTRGHEIDEVTISNRDYSREQILALVEDYAPLPGKALVEMGGETFYHEI